VRPGVNELKLIIPERAIAISTDPGDVVFDPFGGGGSTFQAAENLHRNWVGTELYDCAHIRTRLETNYPISFAQEPAFDFSQIFVLNENNEHPILRRRAAEGL